MGLYKRGRIWWYKFEFRGKPLQGTTRLKNKRLAASFEAKLKTDLALGVIGLAQLKPGPKLSKYAIEFKDFIAIRNKDHPETIDFYQEKLRRLLDYKALADARISDIDEKLIEAYVQHRAKTVAPASINRELATLRRLLRVAWKTHKLITGVPTISKLPGEGEREFVLSQDQEKTYLAAAEDTLRDFAILSLDTGVRAGEGVMLAWDDVHLEPAHGARLGYIQIREGGRKKRGRMLSISPRMQTMFENRRRFFPKAKYVFPGRSDGPGHILVSSMDHQHVRARDLINETAREKKLPQLPSEFVIHSLRHTFGTRLGESGADAYRIMKIMGHRTLQVSQKYVHPTPDHLERAFEALHAMNAILRGGTEAEERLGVVTISATGDSE
jgi:integrase